MLQFGPAVLNCGFLHRDQRTLGAIDPKPSGGLQLVVALSRLLLNAKVVRLFTKISDHRERARTNLAAAGIWQAALPPSRSNPLILVTAILTMAACCGSSSRAEE